MTRSSLVPLKTPANQENSSVRLQRKCACEATGETCSRCASNKLTLQRKATNGGALNSVPPIVKNVLASSGQPLEANTRAYMEPRFDHDFSLVRVHTDAQSAASATAVQARAYTAGNNIVFNTGEYSTQSKTGQRLLAHELAHVVQQGRGGMAPAESPTSEAEADANAQRVISGRTAAPVTQGAAVGVARSPAESSAKSPEAHSFGEIVVDAVVRSVVSQLPGGGISGRLTSAAMYGFVTQMFRELKGDKESNRVKKALAELLIRANAAGFATGYTAGAVAGLISPITDLLGLGALVEQMPMIAANLAKNAWEKSGELAGEAQAIGKALDELKQESLKNFANLLKNPSEIFTILDALDERAMASAGEAGGSAAKHVVAYFSGKDEEPKEGETAAPQESFTDALLHTKPEELSGIFSLVTSKATRLRKATVTAPWEKIGYNVGYAVGAILVNVLLLAATEGIGNLLVELSAGLGKLAPFLSGVEKALVGVGTRIAEVEKAVATALGALLKFKPVSKVAKWLEPFIKPLEELLKRLGGFVRKLLGLPEKAAVKATAGIAAHVADDVAEKVSSKAAPSTAALAEQKPPSPKAVPSTPPAAKVNPPATPAQPRASVHAADDAASHTPTRKEPSPHGTTEAPGTAKPQGAGVAAGDHTPLADPEPVGGGHHVEITRDGIELCSGPPCPNFREIYEKEFLQNEKLRKEMDRIDAIRRISARLEKLGKPDKALAQRAAKDAAELQQKLEGFSRLTDFERKTAGAGGIDSITKRPDPDGRYAVTIEGELKHGLHRGEGPAPAGKTKAPEYNRSSKLITNTEAGLSDEWENLHLWGPGFGDEAAAGIMKGPKEVNQIFQNRGIEGWMRDLRDVVPKGGKVEVKATAIAWDLRGGSWQPKTQVDFLRRAEYKVTVYAPGRPPQRVTVTLDVARPPNAKISTIHVDPAHAANPADLIGLLK